MYLQVVTLEWEYKNLGFGNFVKNVSQKCVEIETWTHTRILYSFPGQMVVHYEEVELSKTLENVLERPMFCEVVARPLVDWLLLSLRTQIFLQWEPGVFTICTNPAFYNIVQYNPYNCKTPGWPYPKQSQWVV